jgi:hypothetical protein
MRYRLSPFGRAVIITFLCMIAAMIIESMIEDQYLSEISNECRKNGYYRTRKIDMTCKINYIKF